ncbi:MAG: glutaminyl-tRNA synthetase [Pseudomonadota bacterium]|jgi:glutaminyl-tRNA synthetase
MNTTGSEVTKPSNFIRQIIEDDRANGKNQGRVVTRFPPEPNGYLHLGHAKSICLNFGLARDYAGVCHLRMDDTNPTKEEQEYVDAIKADVRWLGFDWQNNFFHASDYFLKLHDFAVELIKLGKAYVCELTAEQMREYRGTLTAAGKESPYRSRSVEENLRLFSGMRNGEYPDNSKTLRLKIDMSSSNINMRDPVIYRIRRAHHQRTGDTWCIYPMYDYAHCLSDMIEGITHSICTLEFEDHRPLYDWVLETLKTPCHPQQIEFARLNLEFTMMSKRRLLELVEGKHVEGWDDPRMPTISGIRRRGITAQAIRNFAERVGVTKKNTTIEIELFESTIREDLDENSPRAMAVINPIKVVLTNVPESHEEWIDFPWHPKKPEMGVRKVGFSREIVIEQDDFMEVPPKGFHRLVPGGEVRLRHVGIIKCDEVIKNAAGQITALHCTLDPETRTGMPGSNRKVKGTIHWVSQKHAFKATVRLYDRLFTVPNPADIDDWKATLNPKSLEVTDECWVESSLRTVPPYSRYQFERVGYFCLDANSPAQGKPVFNRIITLRDTWAKTQGSAG